MDTSGPLFIAQEALCYYPISTIYDSCPRYLFYALLLASCLTRWTGWLADVFLGAAATYAGTAAIQSFILVANLPKRQSPSPVTIPYISDNTTLWENFPQLITQTNEVTIQPAALELDGDAVLAIVVTGYLVFLPLQCWSRVLTHERARNLLFYMWNMLMFAGSICCLVFAGKKDSIPTQYMFCYPDIPPQQQTSSDGWENDWRTGSWNGSVWSTFSNISHWGAIGDICYNPCFNSSQILREPSQLQSWVASKDSDLAHPNQFWNKIIYSNRYIYSLIVLCLVLNIVQLTFKWLPYKSHIPSAQIVVIWKERKSIRHGFKQELKDALLVSREEQDEKIGVSASTGHKSSRWSRIRPFFTIRFFKASLRVLVDAFILFGLLFSMIISPLTIIAFVVWIEWWIYNDGPSQEHPQQVGQWSYLVSIALLLVSAVILSLKYKLATKSELDTEIEKTKNHLEKLQKSRDARSPSETVALTASANAEN
ncbi:hypothetical protein N7523_007453 [Penicillium sp. IBT 18751x]|nr:hypothetical protein N7523_007453 [Penicillium sp. IBT 18751x]